MSETKWTPAQRAAIDDRGGALLVSAAAGSGKTRIDKRSSVEADKRASKDTDSDIWSDHRGSSSSAHGHHRGDGSAHQKLWQRA